MWRHFKRKMLLSYPIEDDDYHRSLLIHEFRHAVMHTLQLARGRTTTISTECYFPLSEAEKLKVTKYIEAGDIKVHYVHELLKRERAGTLKQSEKNYLSDLRGLINPHIRHYFLPVEIKTTQGGLGHYFGEGKAGVIADIPEYGYGKLKLLGFKKISAEEYVVSCEVLDPLWTMVRANEKAIASITKSYPAEAYLLERDAHLFQRTFPPLLRELYPEYYQYTCSLVATTFFPERLRSTLISQYDFAYSYELEEEMLLTDSVNFKANRVDAIKALKSGKPIFIWAISII
jgi:hypothetical protein